MTHVSIDNLIAFIPIFSLAINVLIQIVSFRSFRELGLLNSIFLAFVIGLFSLFSLEFRLQVSSLEDYFAVFLAHLFTYVSLGYCYFHFINLGETARRIRIIRELVDAKEGLSLEELLRRYNAKEIVERRLERLIKSNQIRFKNDRYYTANPFMLFMARFIVALKFILFGKKSEFD